jgi:hypothetical protein
MLLPCLSVRLVVFRPMYYTEIMAKMTDEEADALRTRTASGTAASTEPAPAEK